MADPYVSFYQRSIVGTINTAINTAPVLFDPGFYASIQGAGPPGAFVGGLGYATTSLANGITQLVRTNRSVAPTIDPFAVRFSQSSISNNFSAGGSIDGLAMGLRNGTVKPGEVPAIRLVERDRTLFTLDNRRLEAFRRAETPIPFRMATPEETAGEAWKFTTKNGGISIRVRGE